MSFALSVAERLEGLLRHLLERRVGRREDRVGPWRGERLGEARLLHERDERREVARRDGGLDDVGLGRRRGGGARCRRRRCQRAGGERGDDDGGAAAPGEMMPCGLLQERWNGQTNIEQALNSEAAAPVFRQEFVQCLSDRLCSARMPEATLRIGELARRSGVSTDLLRAWERRYGLLDPTRTAGGYRLYSAADEARVRAMQGHLAQGLSAAEAARLAREGTPVTRLRTTRRPISPERSGRRSTASTTRARKPRSTGSWRHSASRRSPRRRSSRTCGCWVSAGAKAMPRSPRSTSPAACCVRGCSALPAAGTVVPGRARCSPARRASITTSG